MSQIKLGESVNRLEYLLLHRIETGSRIDMPDVDVRNVLDALYTLSEHVKKHADVESKEEQK